MHHWKAREIHKHYDEMNKDAVEDDAEREVRESFDRIVSEKKPDVAIPATI